jgi:hypothetical protein
MQAVYRMLTDLVVLIDAAFRWALVWVKSQVLIALSRSLATISEAV